MGPAVNTIINRSPAILSVVGRVAAKALDPRVDIAENSLGDISPIISNAGANDNVEVPPVVPTLSRQEQGLAYQLALMQKPRERSPVDVVTGGKYGFRHGGSSPKGEGWLGNVGGNSAITEYSINVDGREVPMLVPGLSKEQVQRVVLDASGSKQDLRDVEGLAAKWADNRARLGYGAYKD